LVWLWVVVLANPLLPAIYRTTSINARFRYNPLARDPGRTFSFLLP
jgi:hypothetical protein